MKTKTFFMHALILAIGLSFANCNGNKQGIPDTISNDGDYKKAVKDGNFEAAHNILDEMHDDYVKQLAKASQFIPYSNEVSKEVKNFNIISKKYYAALEYIYSKEITLILTNGDDQAADKIVFLLSEIPTDGKCDEGECDYNVAKDYQEEGQNRLAYTNECYVINKLCDKALTLAINRKNKQFAQNLINLYKPDIKIRSEVPKGKEYQIFYIDFKYDTKNAAIARLEEAIKDGLFD